MGRKRQWRGCEYRRQVLRIGRCPESNTNTDTVHGQMFTHTQAAPQSTTPALGGLTTPFSNALWRSYPLRTSSFALGCGGRVGRCSADAQNDCHLWELIAPLTGSLCR